MLHVQVDCSLSLCASQQLKLLDLGANACLFTLQFECFMSVPIILQMLLVTIRCAAKGQLLLLLNRYLLNLCQWSVVFFANISLQLNFECVGQTMLNYRSFSWHPEKKFAMHQESGFLRIRPGTNMVSFILAHNFGKSSVANLINILRS